jgi:hypothetical protein
MCTSGSVGAVGGNPHGDPAPLKADTHYDNILRVTGLKTPPILLTPEVPTIVGGAVLSEDVHKESA